MRLLFLFSSSSVASAITLDGNVSDWFNNSPGAYNDWRPTVEVSNWLNHDGQYITIFPDADNRPYDIEMGATSLASDGLYMMLVLTNPNVWEDIALSVNGSNTHEYGVDLTGIHGAPGVLQDRETYNVTSWQTSHATYAGLPDFNILGGNLTGYSHFIFSEIGLTDDGYVNYLLEGFIPWSALGGRPNSICLQFSEISCLRDSFGLCTNTTAAPVPEPASLLLLGSGVLGIANSRRGFLKNARRRARSV